jgi:hypothetical protein
MHRLKCIWERLDYLMLCDGCLMFKNKTIFTWKIKIYNFLFLWI